MFKQHYHIYHNFIFKMKGGKPTPYDRNLGLKLAAKALDFLINQSENHGSTCDSAVVVGMRSKQIMTTPVFELKMQTDFE